MDTIAPQKVNHLRQFLLVAFIVLVCLASFGWWLYGKFYISTDDAYIGTDIIQVAARVTGQIEYLAVKNNQFVKAGDLMFTLDPATFNAAVAEARATLAAAVAKENIMRLTRDRYVKLAKTNAASVQEADLAEANLQSAMAMVARSQAALQTAQLNLQYTKVTAPMDGWVTNSTLWQGDSVMAHQALFALVRAGNYWVDANFRETDVATIRVGQSVSIHVDMYPGHTFAGVVESISYGSGDAFSLLPPENATGNWVKITQRMPVRIRILHPDPKFPLRVGSSASVRLHLHANM